MRVGRVQSHPITFPPVHTDDRSLLMRFNGLKCNTEPRVLSNGRQKMLLPLLSSRPASSGPSAPFPPPASPPPPFLNRAQMHHTQAARSEQSKALFCLLSCRVTLIRVNRHVNFKDLLTSHLHNKRFIIGKKTQIG